MGNSVCKTHCSNFRKSKQTYVIILNRIYNGAKPKFPGNPQFSSRKMKKRYQEKKRVSNEEQLRLEVHVKNNIKALVDYLESNHNKLADTGTFIYKKASRSLDPEVHIASLLIMKELLNQLKKFTNDKDLLCKLMVSRNGRVSDEEKKQFEEREGNIAIEENYAGSDVAVPYNTELKANIIEFEGSVIELLYFILDQRKNLTYEDSFKSALAVMNTYTKYHVSWIPTEKVEYITTKALDIMAISQKQEKRDYLEKSLLILQIMKNLSKSTNVTFSFKVKFFQYACRTLSELYHDNNEPDFDLQTSSENIISIQKETKLKAFELIEVFVQTLSDFHEFETILIPIFSFFDDAQWNDEQLQKDIFISLLLSMKEYTSLDQIELFLIEKIVDYLNFKQGDASTTGSKPYFHNQELEVKIRVFAVLESILKEVRKSFLSFLVVDKVMNCFVTNLGDRSANNKNDKRLKSSIYSCQKNFLEKVDDSSKSLAQILNSLATQALKKCQEGSPNEPFFLELMTFFEYTIDSINYFPSQIFLPKITLENLLKLRNLPNTMSFTFQMIEKFCNCSFEIEELSDGRNGPKEQKLLPIEYEVAYNLLKSNLKMIKNFMEERRKLNTFKNFENIKTIRLLLHCVRINDSLLDRKDKALLLLQIPYTKEIIKMSLSDLVLYEQNKQYEAKENSGILLYIALRFFQSLSEKWSLGSLDPHLSVLGKKVPIDLQEGVEKSQDKISESEIQKILSSFRLFGYQDSETYEKESSQFLEYLNIQLHQDFPTLAVERLNAEFEDIDPYQNINSLNWNIDDDSSSGLMPIKEPQLRNRKESMSIFSQVHPVNALKTDSKKSVLESLPEEEESLSNSILNSSFKKALKDLEHQQYRETNILKICEEEIF